MLLSASSTTDIYHISKFYELLDTVIRVARGKDIGFLHGYHHTVRALGMELRGSLGW